jgi:hypothetical protein
MNETDHLHLVWALRDRLPFEQITPTHDVSSGQLPDPPVIAGHQPDLIAESLAGTLVIGIAQDGAELDSPETIEGYRALTSYKDPSGELAALVVVVASEHKQRAEEALAKAGVSERSSVFAVNFPS